MEAIQKWLSDFLNIVTRGQPFGWNNVLDVLIVAVFIYYVLLLIRGTRAVQLLIGVMVLVLIYFVATSLHLTLTTLLLQALFAVALVTTSSRDRGRSARLVLGAGTSCSRCAYIVATSESLRSGGEPVRHSYSTHTSE